MPVLFQYLLRLFLSGFMRVVATFMGMFFLIDGIESVRRYSQKVNFNWGDISLMILSRLPNFLTMLLPSFALLTAMIVLTTLSRQSEITVMRASGVSLYRILIPFLMGGILIAGLHIVLQEQIVWRCNQAEQYLQNQITGRFLASQSDSGSFWLRSGRQIVHAARANPSGLELEEISVFRFDNNHALVSRIDAESAYYQDGRWLLGNGTLYHFGAEANAEPFLRKEWPVNLEPVQMDRSNVPEPMYLSLFQLWTLMARLEREGVDTTSYEMTFHRKMADPMTTLTAILLGFPFAMRLPRQGGATRSIFVGLVLGFAMFVIVDLATALGMGNRLPPVVAAWAPVLFFLGIGGFLFLHLAEPRRGG
ncbi:MAG: LPS export ABC transporter permease LptG [Magnetococcales bacterium]|nr:LPS export ABC transporter permease LptG [Magnetococcales bacterium]MBF0151632.1 LPS export ABC transporter permease LptG [Magnetococcales bacterium]MBF0173171.1 LPS export ABC transporter permease LptG [Magnetococcales bacterium]MBF0348619.1 LPS export ABC transporter permease LptG [Magnetococcales bacterium]